MSESTQAVQLNGECVEIPNPITVAGLLDYLNIGRKHVAVERNEKIVSKDAYAETAIEAGDQLEVVTLVGGG